MPEYMPVSQNQIDERPIAGIYKPGRNCWRISQAGQAALLIDCANYYRALHYVFSRARHSIFILGWDIDSRIELLRDEETKVGAGAVTLFDVIYQKATENPDLKIYLNKWDYSIFFMKEREPFCGIKWDFRTPENVHFCADYKVPFGASHHQKIIVVDDEIAFSGGMDIALGRWDHRQHHVSVEQREDPGGFFKPFGSNRYGPYHDIQMMVSGPAARALAQLVRERWKTCAGFEAVPLRKNTKEDTGIWPDDVEPDFENVDIAITRTLPKTKNSQTIREIQTMYLDEIAKAETFIYVENQFLTCPKIARALHDRLKEKSDLRVLIVSSEKPGGIMEHKAMWTGRVKFCGIAGEDIEDGRFCVVYPVCKEDNGQETINIHSKIMIVDDRFLHVGSANLNNRSMGLDTECDLVIEGQNEKACSRIAAIRNNLIREHTGREEEDIDEMINGSASLERLLEYQDYSRQHLLKIDDSPYRGERLAWLARKLGDPEEARILVNIPVKQVLGGVLALALLAFLIFGWWQPDFSDSFNREAVSGYVEAARASNLSIAWIAGIYLVAGAVFFPVTVLNLTTVIVFGPVYGLFLALFGSLVSAAAAFVAGKIIGDKLLFMFESTFEKIKHYVRKGGILGMTLVRFIPIAPYTLVNLVFGLTGVSFLSYMLATFFGLLPGVFAKAVFGGALGELWQDPEPKVIVYTVGSIVLWVLIVWGTHRLFNHYKEKMDL